MRGSPLIQKKVLYLFLLEGLGFLSSALGTWEPPDGSQQARFECSVQHCSGAKGARKSLGHLVVWGAHQGHTKQCSRDHEMLRIKAGSGIIMSHHFFFLIWISKAGEIIQWVVYFPCMLFAGLELVPSTTYVSLLSTARRAL